MEKITYVLEHFGDVVGVVIAENDGELMARTATAVCDNIERDEDGKFELHIGRIGDFGEYIDVKVVYQKDNLIINENEFSLKKVVSYI